LLCAGVQPGGGRIRDCMKEHRAQLSAGCKMAIADRMLERPSHAAANGSASIKPVQQPSSIKSVQQ
jgi:arylformamidase